MIRLLLAVLLLFVARDSVAAQSGAPAGRCALDLTFENPGTLIQLPSGQRNSYVGGNVVARCPSQGIVLRSDSLETYGDEGRFFFIGNVRYSEPRLKLNADYLTYFQREERLLGFLNVTAELPSGSTLRGNQLELWRAIPNVRQQRANSIGRPTVTIIEKDSLGRPQPPVTVTGNNMWLEGDSTVASSGEVVVIRPELTATGDSLFLDGGTGLLRLMRNPRVLGSKGRPFTLVGETIDVLSRQRRLERVLAKNNADATSQDLNLKSDTIDLRIADDVLQRAISWGKSRSRAVSTAQTIIADSIDVRLPNQRLREMFAVRGAVAEGSPDTTRFRAEGKDRLTGDTIVAHFDTLPPASADTSSKPRIRLLVSTGNATSYQHMPSRDTTLRRPDMVYVMGQSIRVTFDSGAVERVRVHSDSLSSGVYLEAVPDSARAAPPGAAPTAPPAGATAPPSGAAATPAGQAAGAAAAPPSPGQAVPVLPASTPAGAPGTTSAPPAPASSAPAGAPSGAPGPAVAPPAGAPTATPPGAPPRRP